MRPSVVLGRQSRLQFVDHDESCALARSALREVVTETAGKDEQFAVGVRAGEQLAITDTEAKTIIAPAYGSTRTPAADGE
jgi:hypothetical protein